MRGLCVPLYEMSTALYLKNAEAYTRAPFCQETFDSLISRNEPFNSLCRKPAAVAAVGGDST